MARISSQSMRLPETKQLFSDTLISDSPAFSIENTNTSLPLPTTPHSHGSKALAMAHGSRLPHRLRLSGGLRPEVWRHQSFHATESIRKRIARRPHRIRSVFLPSPCQSRTRFPLTFPAVDGSKPSGEEYHGCTLGFFGKGCTWQRQVRTTMLKRATVGRIFDSSADPVPRSKGDSPLAGYTISHTVYSPFSSNSVPVNITGNGCDGTTLLCTGRSVVVTPIVDPDVSRRHRLI